MSAAEERRGLIAALASAVIWGVFPFYYHALAHVPALEVLAQRALWSFVFFGTWMAISGRLGDLWRALTGPGWWWILAASLAVSTNWLIYIIAIQTGHTIDSSLGYYMLPLASVALGIVIYGERPRRGQWLAIGLAALAVALLATGLGAAPWISLALATSFSLYGALKKGISLDPVLSVTAEVALLAPLALGYLLWPHAVPAGQTGHFGSDALTTLMLVMTGPLTALPLILFSYGSRRLAMATTGLVMYINPTMQLVIAVIAFGEPFTRWHALAFVLIWLALAIYAAEGWRRARRLAPARRA